MYLSSIQNGIQPAHCVAEMFVKYSTQDPEQYRTLYDWAENHKTMIVLNGGYSDNLQQLVNLLCVEKNLYPWACFCESKEALNDALTCVGIILPERIYEAAGEIKNYSYLGSSTSMDVEIEVAEHCHRLDVRHLYQLTQWEETFVEELNKYGLAK